MSSPELEEKLKQKLKKSDLSVTNHKSKLVNILLLLLIIGWVILAMQRGVFPRKQLAPSPIEPTPVSPKPPDKLELWKIRNNLSDYSQPPLKPFLESGEVYKCKLLALYSSQIGDEKGKYPLNVTIFINGTQFVREEFHVDDKFWIVFFHPKDVVSLVVYNHTFIYSKLGEEYDAKRAEKGILLGLTPQELAELKRDLFLQCMPHRLVPGDDLFDFPSGVVDRLKAQGVEIEK